VDDRNAVNLVAIAPRRCWRYWALILATAFPARSTACACGPGDDFLPVQLNCRRYVCFHRSAPGAARAGYRSQVFRSRPVYEQRRGFRNYPRESKDTPSENAFCRVAPTVRFRDLAILPAGVLSFARPFRLRTSADVPARLFAFLAITPPSSK
jgi:hypothetical protein